MDEAERLDPGALLAADPRDKEIERLKKERDNLRAREERARGEAQKARARLSQFAARSRAFAETMGSQAVERRRVRQRILAQYQIGRALEESRSLEEAGPKVFGVLAETLGFDRGVLWGVDAEAGALRCAGVWDAGDRRVPEAFVWVCEGARLARGEGLPGRVWQNGRVLVVRDVSKEAPYRDDPRREDLVKKGLRGSLAFPVRGGGGASAVFELFCREAPNPDEDLARTMYIVGHQIGQFVERRRAEDEREELLVHAEEARAEAEAARREVSGILESINDAFFALDGERRFTYANRRTEKLWGRAREELLGRSVWETFPAAVGTDYYDAVEKAFEEGEDTSFESYSSELGIWISGRVYPSPGGVSVFFRDVTGRKQAEEALRESEERYRSLTTATSSIVWTGAADGRCVKEMPAWEAYTGQTFEEYRGFGWLESVHPEDRPPADAWGELDTEPVQTEARFRLRRQDGEYRRVTSRGVPIFDEDGGVREYVGTITDVEDELRAREALGETEAKLMGLFDSDVVGIVWGEEETITECNDAMLGMLGYAREELEDGGLRWPAVILPEEQGRVQASVREGKETGRMTPFEKTYVRKSGEEVPTIFGGYCLEAEPFRYVAFVLDISDRKKAEAERDRYLARELRSRAQAEERKRLSRELHDRVAHAIAVVHQSLELYEALKERNPEAAGSRMNLAREMTREALHYTRDLSNRLRNPEVEDGLSAALSNLLSTTVPPHIGSGLSFEGDEQLVPPRAREQLFLILREATRNAVAHSGANHLKIGMSVGEEAGVVTGYVEDDGAGFDARGDGRGPPRSGGLRSMRERAELLGGTLELKSTPGAGTRVEVAVPLEEGE